MLSETKQANILQCMLLKWLSKGGGWIYLPTLKLEFFLVNFFVRQKKYVKFITTFLYKFFFNIFVFFVYYYITQSRCKMSILVSVRGICISVSCITLQWGNQIITK